MNLFEKINKKIQTRYFNKIDRAVDEVKFGLYARINLEVQKKNEKEPGLFAAAVVNNMFSLPPKTIEAEKYQRENKKKIEDYIKTIKNDSDKKYALAQALTIRHQVVFNSIGSGGSDDFTRIPLNNMTKKGIITNDIKIITPTQFIKFAKKYFNSSPDY
ncbi:MAG: hypothetical protein CSA18_03500 [Deltaproteobacteria bacterium]|nr:MAG: hypothetical protein CSA18_03500 [Deltaproteobacteria bacterium]